MGDSHYLCNPEKCSKNTILSCLIVRFSSKLKILSSKSFIFFYLIRDSFRVSKNCTLALSRKGRI